MPKPTDSLSHAERLIRQRGGVVRTTQALALGIHPRTLYALRDQGRLEQLSRGLYRLTDLPPLGNPDLVIVATKVAAGIVCLVSALAFHELTTQIPHEVYVALKKGAKPPRLSHPPLRLFWFGGPAYDQGAHTHKLDGIPVRITTPEKTLADCFRFRNRIGLDVCLEALKLYRSRRKTNVEELLRCARIDRIEAVMRPYLEAIL